MNKINKREKHLDDEGYTYINEERAWNETIYDLLSINCFNNKKYKEALKYINKALKINDKDQRLLNNYRLIKKRRS